MRNQRRRGVSLGCSPARTAKWQLASATCARLVLRPDFVRALSSPSALHLVSPQVREQDTGTFETPHPLTGPGLPSHVTTGIGFVPLVGCPTVQGHQSNRSLSFFPYELFLAHCEVHPSNRVAVFESGIKEKK